MFGSAHKCLALMGSRFNQCTNLQLQPSMISVVRFTAKLAAEHRNCYETYSQKYYSWD